MHALKTDMKYCFLFPYVFLKPNSSNDKKFILIKRDIRKGGLEQNVATKQNLYAHCSKFLYCAMGFFYYIYLGFKTIYM